MYEVMNRTGWKWTKRRKEKTKLRMTEEEEETMRRMWTHVCVISRREEIVVSAILNKTKRNLSHAAAVGEGSVTTAIEANDERGVEKRKYKRVTMMLCCASISL